MTYNEINFKIMIEAVKKIKLIIIISLAFMLIGGIWGYIYISNESEPFMAKADLIEPIISEDIIKSQSYYNNFLEIIDIKIDNLDLYLSKLSKLNLKENADTNKILVELESIKEIEYNKLNKLINYNYIIETEYIPVALEYYNNNILSDERNLLGAKASLEMVSGIQGTIPTDASTVAIYNEQLKNASMISTYTISIDYSKYRLDQLKDVEKIEKDTKEAEELLEKIELKLNKIIDEVNLIVKQIAEENALIIKAGIGVNPDKPTEFDAIVTHTYLEPNDTNDFLAFVTFFTLVGICLGYLTALCKVAKNEN